MAELRPERQVASAIWQIAPTLLFHQLQPAIAEYYFSTFSH
jgi:hypothetical protein